MIGQNGLSENVHKEIQTALDHHELIKIRVPSLDKGTKKSIVDSICTYHGASLIQSIGHVIVIYRCNLKIDRLGKLL